MSRYNPLPVIHATSMIAQGLAAVGLTADDIRHLSSASIDQNGDLTISARALRTHLETL